jgi:hypothetical protein
MSRLARDPFFTVHWILRIGAFACYVGHGAFGIITKEAWVPYFGVVGIPEAAAWRLMPIVGTVDILMGILVLVRPMPVILLYMTVWSVWTALLRPLTGEGWWEFLERAGNYGVPLAFLYWSRPGPGLRDWFERITVPTTTPPHPERLAWILRITTAALLIGHGGFGAFMLKAAWVDYFGAAGITPQMVEAASLVTRLGWFEIALGLLVLAWPVPGVLIFALVWKIGTELLRPMVGEPFWEFIERGGSYAAPLALLYVRRWAHPAEAPPERSDAAPQARPGRSRVA